MPVLIKNTSFLRLTGFLTAKRQNPKIPEPIKEKKNGGPRLPAMEMYELGCSRVGARWSRASDPGS